MGLVRTVGKGVAYLFLAVLILSFLPLVLAYAIGTNWRGSAEKLSSLPGVAPAGGGKSALAALAYGTVVWGLVMVAGATEGDTSTQGAGSNELAVTPTSTPTPAVSTPTVTATPTPTARATEMATATPSGGSTTSPTPTPSGDGLSVTVIDVVDGDTLDIRYQNGTTDTVRLLGVDTPEIHTDNDPSEFEGVPNTASGEDCLRTEGHDASTFAKDRLSGETIRLQFDSQSDRRGSYDRLLAYVMVDGQNFNYQLVVEGYARVYDSEFEQSDRFYSAESDAQATEIGVWRCRSIATSTPTPTEAPSGDGELAVDRVHADAEGNDHDNLNDEYVVFENTGGSTLDIGGWTVEDEAGHTYTVPGDVSVDAGETITLYTGSGSDSDSELYWGSGSAIWNNGGDTVIVTDENGDRVVEYTYS